MMQFWNETTRKWSRRGCITDNTVASAVVDSCFHLTDFARFSKPILFEAVFEPGFDSFLSSTMRPTTQVAATFVVLILICLTVLLVSILYCVQRRERQSFLHDPLGYARRHAAVIVPKRRKNGDKFIYGAIFKDQLARDSVFAQPFFAKPWSSPSRVEGVLLAFSLVSGSLMVAAVFYSLMPSVLNKAVTIAILCSFASSLPTALFAFLFSQARVVDPKHNIGQFVELRKRRSEKDELAVLESRFVLFSQSLLCAKKAARTLVKRMKRRRETLTQKFVRTSTRIVCNILGISRMQNILELSPGVRSSKMLLLPPEARPILSVLVTVYSLLCVAFPVLPVLLPFDPLCSSDASMSHSSLWLDSTKTFSTAGQGRQRTPSRFCWRAQFSRYVLACRPQTLTIPSAMFRLWL